MFLQIHVHALIFNYLANARQNRQIARRTETENGCSNNFVRNTFLAISPSLPSSQSQKEDSVAIFFISGGKLFRHLYL